MRLGSVQEFGRGWPVRRRIGVDRQRECRSSPAVGLGSLLMRIVIPATAMRMGHRRAFQVAPSMRAASTCCPLCELARPIELRAWHTRGWRQVPQGHQARQHRALTLRRQERCVVIFQQSFRFSTHEKLGRTKGGTQGSVCGCDSIAARPIPSGRPKFSSGELKILKSAAIAKANGCETA